PLRGTVLWIDGGGKSALFGEDGQPVEAVRKLSQAGYGVVSGDVFLTGEFAGPNGELPLPKVNDTYCGYTFGYNPPVLSNRVRDILTLIGAARQGPKGHKLHLVGTGAAGPWVLLARGLAGDAVDQTIVDLNGFSFFKVESTSDPNFLPGALKYGGIGGLAALAAPAKLTIAGAKGADSAELKPLLSAYNASRRDRLTFEEAPLTPDKIAEILLASP
ncbi:MAG TPA: hypothetical protein VML55_26670, partial [Planctomycetaceae bacterium]|nr:hypothetical protein [Planctomycetaceae bacterium]